MEHPPNVSDDEREDGEISDDYEDISDFSIPSCGKSDYSQDLLSAISLSSISDSEGAREYGPKHYIPARKRQRRKRGEHNSSTKKKRKKDMYESRRSRPISLSSSDSDVDKVDKRMLRQLKEAVRINSSQEMHHNSLRTRLKGMIDPDTPESEEDEDLQALRTLALLSSNNEKPPEEPKIVDNKSDNLYDKELAELRSEALKSAVLKKHMERKKRKELLTISEQNEINNKENADDNIINSTSEEVKTNGDSVSIEDDVDVMRAMLLASVSTKITSVKPKNNLSTSTPFKNNSIQKPKPIPKTKLKIPSVKPLIINVRSDSDDSDFENTTTTVQEPPRNNPIDHSVTEFLRKQREEFESKQKVVKESDTLDKSVVKLLSEAQQREYQLLQKRLLLANKKRLRRLSQKLLNEQTSAAKKNEEPKPKKPLPGSLKKTLEQLQFEKDGRLQMKGKYKELGPLIQKVNQASDRRKLFEANVNKLLRQLGLARKQHETATQVFTDLVQQLVQATENINKRTLKLANTVPNPGTILKCTNPTTTTAPTEIIKPAVIETPAETIANQEETVANGVSNNTSTLETVTHDEDSTLCYISPLDNRESTISKNPLKALCPYELFGVCKDQDCNFNHCP